VYCVTTFTRWILRNQRYVAAFWIVVTLVGIVLVSPITGALSQGFNIPGQEGDETNNAILREFGIAGGRDPLVPVVTLPPGTTVDSPVVKQDLSAVFAKLQTAFPGGLVLSYASTGDRAFVSENGRTTFGYVIPAGKVTGFGDGASTKKAEAALKGATVGGAPVLLTGSAPLANGGGGDGGPGVFLEALLGGVGALIVLAFVFGSLLAFVPILMAIAAIMGTFLVIGAINTAWDVSFLVEFLVALIGLGIAIDYSLLVVMRWREELAEGRDNTSAVVRAMETAGEAVIHSGSTVAIGLVALVILPVQFMRSLGVGGMLIPLVSVLVAITLLPVVLNTIGPKIDWPHPRHPEKRRGPWTRWAELVVRRRWIIVAASLPILAVLIVAAAGINMGSTQADSLASKGEAHDGLKALEAAGPGAGALSPTWVLAPAGNADELAANLSKTDGVRGVVVPGGQWEKDGKAIIAVLSSPDASSSGGRSALSNIRETAHAVDGAKVGGSPASLSDSMNLIYDSFPLMVAVIAIATFLLLARAFRSLLLPLKAVILNILSVGAAWGVMVLVWQHGWGSDLIWGITGTGATTFWVPLMVFAFLFGISMDYEVFILARMREEYDENGSTDGAIVEGIGRTGRLVTFGALILFLAFASLASGPQTDIKVFATGLAAGIVLDATIVRSMLVPALVSLFGRWNWWLPSWPAKLLRVEPSFPHRDRAPAESPGGGK
jgi:RND superfamily putative drug exporter